MSDKLYASCLVNPVTGHEGEYDFTPVSNSKKVLVAGGGQFRLAAVPPTKSVPAYPPIEGIHNEKFLTVADVLDGKALPGSKVLIAGGGMSGVETADFLSEHFRACTVIETQPDIALDEEYTPSCVLDEAFGRKNIAAITSAKITKFYDAGIDYEQNGEAHSVRGFDSVILAMGMKVYNPLEEIAKQHADEVYVVGDAKGAGPANKVTEEELAAGLKI